MDDIPRELKAHPRFHPVVGMVGQDGSVIVRVGGLLGPVAAYVTTAEADDEGIEVFERRIDDGWLPDLHHPATGGILLDMLSEYVAMYSTARSIGGSWFTFIAGDGVGHVARSFGESVAQHLLVIWSADGPTTQPVGVPEAPESVPDVEAPGSRRDLSELQRFRPGVVSRPRPVGAE